MICAIIVIIHKQTQASEKSYDNKLGAHASQELSGVMNNTNIKLNDVIVITHIERVLPSRWRFIHRVINDGLEGEADEVLSSSSFLFAAVVGNGQ